MFFLGIHQPVDNSSHGFRRFFHAVFQPRDINIVEGARIRLKRIVQAGISLFPDIIAFHQMGA